MTSTPHGILLIDKELEWTSHDVVAKLRGILGTKTIGHTGTLDPLASGLLVILVGEYTRLSNYVLAQEKTYETEVTFGRSTTTDDAEGETVKTIEMPGLKERALKETLEQFKGTISQKPPAYSAISVGGEKLYKKARRGEEVDVPLRQVQVSEISLLELTEDTCRLRIRCSKGTYIRSIARDLGEAMGGAAFCSALRRTAVGEFSVSEALKIGSSTEAHRASLLTGHSAKVGLPPIQLQKQEAMDLSHGKKIGCRADIQIKPGELALAFYGDEIWAIVAEHQGEIIVKRGFGKQV